MENEKTGAVGDLTLQNRRQLTVTKVKKIKSSAPEQVVLVLNDCALVVTGADLFVVSASVQSGEVVIEGLVKALRYTGLSAKRKFSFKNMFR